MVERNSNKYFDLIGLGLIALLCLLSVLRLIFLAVKIGPYPQFLDGYYHLAVANGFIESGGWVGWDWWSFAPFGRPHLYPPVYHLILTVLSFFGLVGIKSVFMTEILIIPVFFISLWFILRSLVNNRVAFINLVALSSFLPFYACISDNIPASLAIIFGLWSLFFVKKRSFVRSSLLLTIALYTHFGSSLILVISFFVMGIFIKDYRRFCISLVVVSLLFAFPLIFHQAKYINQVSWLGHGEIDYINYSPILIILSVISLCLHLKRRDLAVIFFYGFVLGSAVIFGKYPYRLFSAQGAVGLFFFSSLLLEKIYSIRYKTIIISFCIMLLLIHPTVNFDKKNVDLSFSGSTYYRLLTGKIYQFFKLTPFIINKFCDPVVETIKLNSNSLDIVNSNLSVGAQIFSALSGRPSADSIFKEVKTTNNNFNINSSKITVWLKLPDLKNVFFNEANNWRNIYENSFACVFLNINNVPLAKVVKAKIGFHLIFLLFTAMVVFFIIADKLIIIFKKRKLNEKTD